MSRKGIRFDPCVICGARGSGYRRVAYPFQETGYSEERGLITLVAFSQIYEPGAVCWRHNYQQAEPEAEQLSFLGGQHDEQVPSTGAV